MDPKQPNTGQRTIRFPRRAYARTCRCRNASARGMRNISQKPLKRGSGRFRSSRRTILSKAVAKRCGEWIRNGNVKFASVAEFGQIQDMLIVETEAGSVVYIPFGGFTADTLGYERGQYSSAISTRLCGACATPFRTRFGEVLAGGGMTTSPDESLRELEARHYRAESLRADLVDIERKLSREVQLDRKYALAKEKQRIERELGRVVP